MGACHTRVVGSDLSNMRSGVVPEDVKTANREAHKRVLDAQTLGLMISSAAAAGVEPIEIEGSFRRNHLALKHRSKEYPVPVEECLNKAKARYQFQ